MTNSIVHGRGLGRARRLHGLTPEVCAERAGVTVETWQRWEAGDAWPTELDVRRVFPVGRETLMRLGAAEAEG